MKNGAKIDSKNMKFIFELISLCESDAYPRIDVNLSSWTDGCELGNENPLKNLG